MTREFSPRPWLDRFGSLGSALCVTHCLLSAVAPGVLSVVGIGGHLGHRAMNAMMVAAVVLGSLAALSSYRIHRSPWITCAFALGVVGIFSAYRLHAAHQHGLGMTLAVVSGIGLATAHLVNLRTCRRCSSGAAAPSA